MEFDPEVRCSEATASILRPELTAFQGDQAPSSTPRRNGPCSGTFEAHRQGTLQEPSHVLAAIHPLSHETAVQQVMRSRVCTSNQKALVSTHKAEKREKTLIFQLEQMNDGFASLVQDYNVWRETHDTEALNRFLRCWETTRSRVDSLQATLIGELCGVRPSWYSADRSEYRSGIGRRYHMYSGFFINLPFAYMTRQFPKTFDDQVPASNPGTLLAMHKVVDPSRNHRAGFRCLERLLDLAISKDSVKGSSEQSEWRRANLSDGGRRVNCWILSSEE